MENKNLKNKKNKGRPPYTPNIKQLQDLYTKIANNELTNSERLEISTVARKQNGLN